MNGGFFFENGVIITFVPNRGHNPPQPREEGVYVCACGCAYVRVCICQKMPFFLIILGHFEPFLPIFLDHFIDFDLWDPFLTLFRRGKAVWVAHQEYMGRAWDHSSDNIVQSSNLAHYAPL